MTEYKKPLPQPTPETQHFWDGCRAGKLLLQRCKETGKAYFPPRPFSPFTGSRDVEVFEASGKATLYSYVINHRPARGFEADAPYAIAVVQLPEGVRMMGNVTGVGAEELRVGLALEAYAVEFEPGLALPFWRPAR